MHTHFPTFHRVTSLGRFVRNERGLLRLALYLMLAVSATQWLAIRTLKELSGRNARPGWNFQEAYFPETSSASLAIRLLSRFVNYVGMDEQICLFLAAVTLGGLASSAKASPPNFESTSRLNDDPPSMESEPSIVLRHPLDPEPGDPPPQSPWNRR